MAKNDAGRLTRRRRRGSGVGARTEKVTVTVPGNLLAAAAARVQAGGAPSLSAYVSDALARQVMADAQGDAFLALLDQLDEELGPPSEADYAWARQFASR